MESGPNNITRLPQRSGMCEAEQRRLIGADKSSSDNEAEVVNNSQYQI